MNRPLGWLIATPPLLTLSLVLSVTLVARLQPEPPPPIGTASVSAMSSGGDPFADGMAAYRDEHLEDAVAAWLQVGPEHPQYAKAQRFIGWEIHARRFDSPLAGIGYVNRALLHAPLDGNVWQDWSRTYLSVFRW